MRTLPKGAFDGGVQSALDGSTKWYDSDKTEVVYRTNWGGNTYMNWFSE